MWVRDDSQNGYFFTVRGVHREKEMRRRTQAGSSSSEGPHQRATRQMAPCLFGKKIYVIQLLSDLEKSGIYGCGTARKDRRGFPEKLKTAKFKNR